MNAEIIGITAGVLSCVTFLPQVIKTYKSKSAKDVSSIMFVIAVVSTSLWLAYGILVNNFPLVFTNAIVLTLSIIMVILKIRYSKSEGKK